MTASPPRATPPISSPPAPAPTLDDARRALRTHFGYEAFRAGQEMAVESVLAGRDTLVILPTGGGKSLCFQVPALLLPGLTVVVSPLISLMKDQVDALTARSLPAAFINSTLTQSQAADRLARAARGELKLLYVAPERFDVGSTAERLRAMGVSLLAVDEAHCISEWGHDFRPSYLRIRAVRDALGAPPTIALTATATPEVREDIARQLALREPRTVITGFDRTNLSYHVLPARNDADKDALLVRTLRDHEGLAVVYAPTRKAVERITQALQSARVPTVGYHAGLDDAHRHDVQEAFMTERSRVIVATNAFGMGIDKANVRLVVHHAMPGTLEAYYQEAGRAGRDGRPSAVFLLHAFPDRFTHEFFIRTAYPDRARVTEVYELLRRRCDAAGLVRLSVENIASSLEGKWSPREVESALRTLERGGGVRLESGAGARVFLRLLATPERIRAELTGEDDVERGLLRALWRAAGARLQEGAVVNLDGLPPGFGGAFGARPLLEALQARQFLVWEPTDGGLRVADRARSLARLEIDWATIERRRRGELGKLDAMQRYAYTPGCRRGFVLRYFGDPAARAHCEGCDNCLGTHQPAEKAARGGRAARKGGGRVRGERGNARTPVSDGRPSSRPAAANGAVEVGPGDLPLFAALKALRSEIARADRVPGYAVFADRTLAELAVRRPRTIGALSDVRGVGPAKLEKYGERFLAVIRSTPEPEAT